MLEVLNPINGIKYEISVAFPAECKFATKKQGRSKQPKPVYNLEAPTQMSECDPLEYFSFTLNFSPYFFQFINENN